MNTFLYHLTPAAHLFDRGLALLGCTVVPTGPGNVETQVRTWAGQIHRATAEPFLVIRCQSSEAADKAMAALGNKAVRLGPNNVGWSAQKLTAALRQKLASQGVIVG